MADLKTFIKSHLVKRIDDKYDNELKNRIVSFESWISNKEATLPRTDMSIGMGKRENEGKADAVSDESASYWNSLNKSQAVSKEKPIEVKVKGMPQAIEIGEYSFVKRAQDASNEPPKQEDEILERPENTGNELTEQAADDVKISSVDYLNTPFVSRVGGTSFRIIPYNIVEPGFVVNNYLEDILVFVNGELTPWALVLIAECFGKNPKISVVYGDEDIADLSQIQNRAYGEPVKESRSNPYFKPDWSPNSFLHHFYFCNIVAIRRSAFREVVFKECAGERNMGADVIYHALLEYITSSEYNILNSVKHIDEILLHASDYDNNRLQDAESLEFAKKLTKSDDGIKISVVIPSKDNPDLLKDCLTALSECRNTGIDMEIIVVDNGSSGRNRVLIEKMSESTPFKYLYVKSEFNFSTMCNLGAQKACGQYLLFLNDDVEVSDYTVVKAMLDEAKYKFTGAVGVKLLYPDSTKIQHAGVINNRIGPVHKFQYMDDAMEYYHGFNRYPQNLLAVTAACLMVRKEYFEAVGGFDTDLRVAFNDIDLCFKLYEAGYMNVSLNNYSCVHKESFSRGSDTDAASLRRLMDERRKLYSKHPALKARDPFYGKYNINDCLDTDIIPANNYEYQNVVTKSSKVRLFNNSNARIDMCLSVTVEYSGDYIDYCFDKSACGQTEQYIQGYTFVIGSDNALYDFWLLLADRSETYMLPFSRVLRMDVSGNCPDQKNIELCGFSTVIDKLSIPRGTYTVGVAAGKKFSKEMIYNFSNREVTLK